MKIVTVSLGDINGSSTTLPDRAIIKAAQRNMCMSAAFWGNIKSGKFPYIFNQEKKTLVEASYTETVNDLNKGKGNTVNLKHLLAGTPAENEEKEKPLSMRADKIYWVTDEEFPEANDIMKDIAATEELKQSYLQKIEKFK